MKLRLVVALLAGLFAMPAAAVFNFSSLPADIEFKMSGASAIDLTMANTVIKQICDPNEDIVEFRDIPNDPDYRAVFCTVANTTIDGAFSSIDLAPIAGETLFFSKRAAGGSGYGVVPVARSSAIDLIDVNSTDCSADPTFATSGDYEPETTEGFVCLNGGNAAVSAQVPDCGVSDVEPALFLGPNVVADFGDVSPSDIASLDADALFATSFGIPASLKLRNCLQYVQGLTVGSDLEADMPSLPTAAVKAIADGGMSGWNQVRVTDPDDSAEKGLFDACSNVNAPAAVQPADEKVLWCRRASGSGTLACFNATYLRAPCISGFVPPASGTASRDDLQDVIDSVITIGDLGLNGQSYIVVENGSSGRLGDCLDKADQIGLFAIGHQATEKNTGKSDAYRFIRVDGVSPSLAAAQSGEHIHVCETSFQCRTPNDLSAGQGLVRDALFLAASAVTSIETFAHDDWTGGNLALPTAAFCQPESDGSFNPANPCYNWSKSASGSPNNCDAPTANRFVNTTFESVFRVQQ